MLALLFLVILTAPGCTLQVHPKPNDLIPKAQMISMLKDYYLADAFAASVFETQNREYRNLVRYKGMEKLIYRKYKVSGHRFETSLEYYLYSDQTEPLFTSLFDQLNEDKKKIMADSSAFRKKDSLAHPERRIKALATGDSIRRIVQKRALDSNKLEATHPVHKIKKRYKNHRKHSSTARHAVP